MDKIEDVESLKIPKSGIDKYRHIVCVTEDIKYDSDKKICAESINGGADTIWPESWKDWSQVQGMSTHLAHHSIFSLQNICRYYEVKELPENVNYFYLINILNPLYFERNYKKGLSGISSKVVQDLKDKKAKLILVQATEGNTCTRGFERELLIVQEWIDKANIPGEAVCYINSNLLSRKFAQEIFKVSYEVIGLSTFEGWNNIFNYKAVDYKPIDNNSLYLNLNRTPRYHRICLLAELNKLNLLDKGLNSWNLTTAPNLLDDINLYKRAIESYNEEAVEASVYFFNNPVKVLDTSVVPNLAVNVNKQLYEQSFVSLVTETIVDNESIFLTEKTWKPIIMGHPFLLLCANGSLAVLKSFGFKTFDKWFDESYDNAASLKDKIQIITNNLKKYENKSIDELKVIREEMQEICDFNRSYLENRMLYAKNLDYHFALNSAGIRSYPVIETLLSMYNNW